MLRKEHKLKLSESKIVRRVFRPETEEVTGEWRKLHNEELHNFCSSSNVIKDGQER
jgi:hypothetical protein